MDITPFLTIEPAPKAVFRQLPSMGDRPRFLLPNADGTWRPVTWNTFAGMIRAVALFLAESGFSAGDRAAVFAPNRVEWIAAALGIESAAGVMVPVYPASTAEQAAYVLSHCDARAVFVDTPAVIAKMLTVWDRLVALQHLVLLDDALDVAAVHRELHAAGKSVPSLDAVLAKTVRWQDVQTQGAALHARDSQRFDRTMDAIDLDQPAVMLYTSGTTGNPKGVPLTHRNVGVNGGDWLQCNAPLLDEGAVDALWLPMSHIFGFGEACLGNTLGWTTYLVDPATVLSRLPEVQPTVFMSVPAYWEKLAINAMQAGDAESQAKSLSSLTGGRLRFCLSGGAGLKREVKEFFHRCGVLIIEGYGLTETSPTLTLNRPDAFRFDSVGRVLPSVELKLADDGEILARGASVFRGYHKDPAATREAFTDDGWFKTGDVGRWTEDGFLQIIDRKKDILVTAGGKNVPPANIEIRFADEPLISHVVVYGDGKRYLVAGIWPNEAAIAKALEGRMLTPDERKSAILTLLQTRVDAINSGLASFETIKRFAVIDKPLSVVDGTLTASLKVRRKKVYETYRELFESLYEEHAPSRAARA